MYVYHMHARCPQRSEEGIRFPKTQVTDGLSASAWVLGTEPGTYARAANAPEH